MEPDRLDAHNERQFDNAARTLVESLRRAVTEKPHGRLTLTLEWRGFAAHRLIVTEEKSELLIAQTE